MQATQGQYAGAMVPGSQALVHASMAPVFMEPKVPPVLLTSCTISSV
jgi:hypothetical protein